MDVYTRDLLVKPRQDDLLREAADRRLAREARRAARAKPAHGHLMLVLASLGRPVRHLLAMRHSRRAPTVVGTGVAGAKHAVSPAGLRG